MKRGYFEMTEQAGSDAQPYRRGNFSCAYEWLEEVDGVLALLSELDALRAADPQHRYLCTLDDISQCSYTCGHAGHDDRLYLEEQGDDSIDWDDPVQEAAWEQTALQHRVRQLGQPALIQRWDQVCGTLATAAYDVAALLHANRDPDALLDDVVYVQRIPVAADDLMIVAQPNGYFSADWDTFQNHAIIRHLSAQYGYRFFGMGAAWMGFVRSDSLSGDQAGRLVADLQDLYGRGQEPVRSHAGWAELQQLLQNQSLLMLGYVENMAESLGLDDAA